MPQALGGKLPTGASASQRSRSPTLNPLARFWSQRSPHGKRESPPDRAATSHSDSVGSRLPAQRANSRAWNQLTQSTGWSARAGSS